MILQQYQFESCLGDFGWKFKKDRVLQNELQKNIENDLYQPLGVCFPITTFIELEKLFKKE